MPLTPEEIRHLSIGRAVRGYDRHATDKLLAEIATSYEAVWRQAIDLREQLKRAEAAVQELDHRAEVQTASEADLRRQVGDQAAELESVRQSVTALEGERQGLVADLERTRAEAADRRDLAGECERLTSELAAVRAEATRLVNAERTRLGEHSRRSDAMIADLRRTIAQLEEKVEQLKDETRRSDRQIQDLRRELAAREAEQSRLLEDAERSRVELVELRYAERTHASILARSEDELRRRDAEIADLRRELRRVETERAAERNHAATVEAALRIHRQVAGRLRDLLFADPGLTTGSTRVRRWQEVTPGVNSGGEPDDAPPSRRPHGDDEHPLGVGSGAELFGDLQPDAGRETDDRSEPRADRVDLEARATTDDWLAGGLRTLLIENLRLLEAPGDLHDPTPFSPRPEDSGDAATPAPSNDEPEREDRAPTRAGPGGRDRSHDATPHRDAPTEFLDDESLRG